MFQIKFYTADRLPCQNDGFNAPSDFTAVKSTLPACSMIPNQQNFTSHDERFNLSTIFSKCQIGQGRVTFKSDQAQ